MKDYITPKERLNFKITGKEDIKNVAESRTRLDARYRQLLQTYVKRREASKTIHN